MFHVALSNGRSQEINADRITFDEGMVWFWSQGLAITSHPSADIEGLTASHDEHGGDGGVERAVDRARTEHPRAFELWTDAEDDRLRDAHAKGMTRVQLSEMFERQPAAIRSRLYALGITTEMSDESDE
ncbi:MAG: hypothetical protein JWM50_246 [Microbacteriaceae bacterium]|jgi:hypothetical protein|nr:hypothetical protein [Microbacteriaceae bacterium]